MKSLIIVIILTAWLPWTDGSREVLSKGRVARHQAPCFGNLRGWYSPGNKVGICSTVAPEALPMVMLHESQHYLAAHYGIGSWGEFSWQAMACTWTESERVRVEARKFAGMSGYELHAQLPWLMQGHLCPELQPWYPWFDIKGVKNK